MPMDWPKRKQPVRLRIITIIIKRKESRDSTSSDNYISTHWFWPLSAILSLSSISFLLIISCIGGVGICFPLLHSARERREDPLQGYQELCNRSLECNRPLYLCPLRSTGCPPRSDIISLHSFLHPSFFRQLLRPEELLGDTETGSFPAEGTGCNGYFGDSLLGETAGICTYLPTLWDSPQNRKKDGKKLSSWISYIIFPYLLLLSFLIPFFFPSWFFCPYNNI